MKNAIIVTDLGFGDQGKGKMVDYLARKHGSSLVVRTNGGCQSSHHVVTPYGITHGFSQFGAGTFAGTNTFLSGEVIVHPTALLVEAEHLERKGVKSPLSRIRIDENCLLTTPYHQAANRIREALRGDTAHGTCGSGVGETVRYQQEQGKAPLAANLRHPRAVLLDSVNQVRSRLYLEMLELTTDEHLQELCTREWGVFNDAEIASRWVDAARRLEYSVVDEDVYLREAFEHRDTVIFEGAQGVLLDEWRGFHPHTTWSTCTSENAMHLLRRCAPDDVKVKRIGVLRSYATRHGNGPFPTENSHVASIPEYHNRDDAFQGKFRKGWFDAVLANYAIEANRGIEELAITHLDVVDTMFDQRMLLCAKYSVKEPVDRDLAYTHTEWESKYFYRDRVEQTRKAYITKLRLSPKSQDLSHSERLTKLLNNVTPEYVHIQGREQFLEQVSQLLQHDVTYCSTGPTHLNTHEL